MSDIKKNTDGQGQKPDQKVDANQTDNKAAAQSEPSLLERIINAFKSDDKDDSAKKEALAGDEGAAKTQASENQVGEKQTAESVTDLEKKLEGLQQGEEKKLTLEDLEKMKAAAAGESGESGFSLPPFLSAGHAGDVDSVPRDLGLPPLVNNIPEPILVVVSVAPITPPESIPPDAHDDGFNPEKDPILVFESGLPGKGSDLDPNNPSPPGQPAPIMVAGNILANDDLGNPSASITKISFGGQDYFPDANGVVTAPSTRGTLVVYTQTGGGHNAGDFTYTLLIDSDHPLGNGKNELGETFTYTLTNPGGSDTADILIRIVDDVPIAVDDGIKTVEEGHKPLMGNLLVNDVSGADGPAKVIAFLYDNGQHTAFVPDGGSTTVSTALGGILTVASDGSWEYFSPTSVDNSNDPVHDDFNYTITDSDADHSSANQGIIITDGPPPDPHDDGFGVAPDSYQVYESGLASGSDLDSNNPNPPAQPKPTSVTGNVLPNDSPGSDPSSITSVTFNNVSYTPVNGIVTINTGLGILTLYTQAGNGHAEGEFNYQLLTDTDHPSAQGNNSVSELFSYTVTDIDGDSASAQLQIKIIDDVPIAVDDAAKSVEEGKPAITGNVMTNDVQGADAPAKVMGISYDGGAHTASIPNGGSVSVLTALGGNLTVFSSGAWSYIPPASVDNSNGAVHDDFGYQLFDSDNDSSSAIQPILITDGPPPDPRDDGAGPAPDEFIVYESGLPGGSDHDPNNPNAPAQAKPTQVSGNVLLNDTFGSDPASIVKMTYNNSTFTPVNGVITIATPDGVLVLYTMPNNGHNAGDFTFTLNTQDAHPDAQGNNDILRQFGYTLQDIDGDGGDATLTIKVVDDVPQAINDPAKSVEEGKPAITGNVMTNDVQGADIPAKVTGISYDGGAHTALIPNNGSMTVLTALGGSLTVSSTGAWSYVPPASVNNSNGAVHDDFGYTITDADKDSSSALQPILITDGPPPDPHDDGVGALPEQFIVYESGLPTGSDLDPKNPNAPAQPHPTEVSGNVLVNDTFGSDPASITQIVYNNVTYIPVNGVITIPTADGLLTLFTQPVGLHLAGDFTFDLTSKIDHPAGQGNNDLFQQFTYTLADSDGDSGTANLIIKVVDDVPTAINDCYDIVKPPLPSYNLVFTLDISGSMGQIVQAGKSRLDVVKEALVNNGALLDSYEAASSNLHITIVTFSSGSKTSLAFTDVDAAKAYINALNAGGTTNYTAAINSSTAVINADAVNPALNGYIDKFYFMSDGVPNPTSSALNASQQAAWQNVLNTNNVDSIVLNIAPPGNQASVDQYLNPIANTGDSPMVYHVNADLSNLQGILIGTIGDLAHVSGNIVANDVSGADTGIHVTQIQFSFASSQSASQYLSAHPELVGATANGSTVSIPIPNAAIITPLGQTLELTSNGDFTYTINSQAPSSAMEDIIYTIVDHDGDTSSAEFCFIITPADIPPVPKDDGLGAAPDQFIVYESGLPSGSDNASNNPNAPPQPKATVVAGNILANDTLGNEPTTITKMVFNNATFTAVNGVITIPTADGVLKVYTLAGNGHQAGDFEFTLSSSIDHPTAQGMNLLLHQFNYTIVDIDGDSADAKLVIKVVDDVPSFVNINDPDANNIVEITASNPASTTVSNLQLADWLFGADEAGSTPSLQSVSGNVVLLSSSNSQIILGFYDSNNALAATLTLNSDGTDSFEVYHRAGTISQDTLLTGEAKAGGPGIYFVDSSISPNLTVKVTGNDGDGISEPNSDDQVNPSAQGWAVDNNIIEIHETIRFEPLSKSNLSTHIPLSNFAFDTTGFTGGQSAYDIQVKVFYHGGSSETFSLSAKEGQTVSVKDLPGFNSGSLIDAVEVTNVDSSPGGNIGFRLNNVTIFSESETPPEDLNYNFSLGIIDKDGDTDLQSFSVHLNGESSGTPPVSAATLNDSAIVYESGLPYGSDNSKPISASGNVLANDTLPNGASIKSVTFNGTDYLSVNGVITIQTLVGTLLLYSANANGHIAGDFEYTLNQPAQHDDGLGNNVLGESFTYNILYSGDKIISAELNVQVVDDVPKAIDDATVDSSNGAPASGNVLTNDISGADVPPRVTSFTYDGGAHSANVPDGSSTTVATAQGGLLTVWSDGSWKYVPPEITSQGSSSSSSGDHNHSGNVDKHTGNTDHHTHGSDIQATDHHSGSASGHSGNIDHHSGSGDHHSGSTDSAPKNVSFHDDFTYTMSDADGDKSTATQFILVTAEDSQNDNHHSGSSDHDKSSGGHDSSHKNDGCVTEIFFHTDDAKQYIHDHHLSDLNAMIGSDGKSVHILLPKDGSDIEFTTPSGSSLCINNKGDYSYTAAYDKIKDGGESFNCLFKDDRDHYFQGKLDINAHNHPDSLADLLGSKHGGHDDDHGTVTLLGDANNGDYIVDASQISKPESIPMKDLDMNLGNVLNYLKIAHDASGNDAASHDALSDLGASAHNDHSHHVDPANYTAPAHTDEQVIQQHIDQAAADGGTPK